MRLACLALATTTAAALAAALPEHLGEFTRTRPIHPAVIPAGDRSLMSECRLRATEAAEYTTTGGRTMSAEAFILADSRAGHAVFLWLRPGMAAHSRLGSTTTHGDIFGESFAAVGNGSTLVQWQNYVFRFRRAAPETSDLNWLLDQLQGVDATAVEPDECCAYFAEGSERIILGPVGLARFAPRIPPSAAAFRLGAVARSARYETPAGPIDRVVFEYPEAHLAEQRLPAFAALGGAIARRQGRKVGVIFDPPDRQEAEQLLAHLEDSNSRGAVSFDLSTMTDGPMTLDDGLTGIFFGGLIGVLAALLAAAARQDKGIRDRTISLRLSI